MHELIAQLNETLADLRRIDRRHCGDITGGYGMLCRQIGGAVREGESLAQTHKRRIAMGLDPSTGNHPPTARAIEIEVNARKWNAARGIGGRS